MTGAPYATESATIGPTSETAAGQAVWSGGRKSGPAHVCAQRPKRLSRRRHHNHHHHYHHHWSPGAPQRPQTAIRAVVTVVVAQDNPAAWQRYGLYGGAFQKVCSPLVNARSQYVVQGGGGVNMFFLSPLSPEI